MSSHDGSRDDELEDGPNMQGHAMDGGDMDLDDGEGSTVPEDDNGGNEEDHMQHLPFAEENDMDDEEEWE